MISKWHWLLSQLGQQLWLRAGLFALMGILTALLGVAAETFLPPDLPDLVGADAVGTVLNVLASSMLAVTTFSLGVMVSAYSAATTNVTPRATRLLMQDSTTQNVLSTFIGSFLFSLVGIVTLTIEGYGDRGRLVLFVVTIIVIVVVVMALLGWVDHLSRLGRVSETSERVEQAATLAIRRRSEQPYMGGQRLDGSLAIPPDARAVVASETGYVQHVDTAAIQDAATEHGARVYLQVLPGTFVHAGRQLALVDVASGTPADELGDAVGAAITVGHERTFEQDPRFGLVVLAEIASRALSPAINDSGTAIDIIGRLARVLSCWANETGRQADEVKCPAVYVPALAESDLFEDAFMMIARDGADRLEVQLRVQKALRNLSEIGDPAFKAAAVSRSLQSLGEAERGLHFVAELERVRAASPMAGA